MNKMNHTTGTIKSLKTHYFLNVLFLVALFLLALFNFSPFNADDINVSITLERYVIIVTMLVIPLSLKYFAHRLKKIQRPAEASEAIQKYKKASSLRLYALSILTLLHILLFSISRNTNFLWFTVVLFIVFFYCKPSEDELQSLMEQPEIEDMPKNAQELSAENGNNDISENNSENASKNISDNFAEDGSDGLSQK